MAKKKKATKKKHAKKKAAKKNVAKSKGAKSKRGMLLVHRTALAGAARITASETTRNQVAGVRVDEQKGGGYRVEATDGRRLIRIEGKSDPVADFPVVPGAGEFKNVTISTHAVKAAVKATANNAATPILENVAVMVGSGQAVRLVATNRITTADIQSPPLEDNWPPTDKVWPKDKAVGVVGVDTQLLAELLLAIRDAAPGYENRRVVKLEIFGPKKPIRITTSDDRHKVTALLMPCALNGLA